jgi:hypothetical protein
MTLAGRVRIRSSFHSPPQTVVSPEPFPRPPDLKGEIPNEGELAWQLASEVAPTLPSADKTELFLKLGCGDHFDAIVDMLDAVGQKHLQISASLLSRIGHWQRGYVGSSGEADVLGLLGEARFTISARDDRPDG